MITNNKKLNTKDAFMLVKAIKEVADKIYKNKSDRFIKELENTADKQYRSEYYGLLHLKSNKAKTTKIYTKEEQIQIDKIDAQIAKLQAQKDKLGIEVETQAEYNSLVAKLNTTAENDALEIIKEITSIIDSKTLTNTIDKVASKTARIK